MIKAQVLGVDKVQAKLGSAPEVFMRHMRAAMTQAVIKIQSTTKSDYLSGGALQRRTNNLSGSIHTKVTESATSVTGKVGTNVKYAPVHEFGGTFTIPAHVRAGAQVKTHTATYPARPFLRPSYENNREEIKDLFRAACNAAAKEVK